MFCNALYRQVLEFITQLTIAVHQQLLGSAGVPPGAMQKPAVAFGSSTGMRNDGLAAAAKQQLDACHAAAQQAASIQASGSRIDLSQARRILPTLPRQCQAQPVPVYVVPRPGQHLQLRMKQQGSRAADGYDDPLRGWEVFEDDDDRPCAAGGAATSAGQWAEQPLVGSLRPQSREELPSLPTTVTARQDTASSCGSSESSWAS